jgi:enoyl-CoA hydratase/carnithine racemase
MDRNARALVVFIGSTLLAAALHRVASEEAAKIGLPHAAVGAIIALADRGG